MTRTLFRGSSYGRRMKTADLQREARAGAAEAGWVAASPLPVQREPCAGGWIALLLDVTAEYALLERFKTDYAAREALMHAAEVGVWRYDPDTELYQFSSELSLGHADAGPPVPLEVLRRLQHPDDIAVDDAVRDRLTREGGAA